MISGFINKKFVCNLVKSSLYTKNDGFVIHHYEQWDIVSRETNKYIGTVSLEEVTPLVSDEKYDMFINVLPLDYSKPLGCDHIGVQVSRIELLNTAAKFIQNN